MKKIIYVFSLFFIIILLGSCRSSDSGRKPFIGPGFVSKNGIIKYVSCENDSEYLKIEFKVTLRDDDIYDTFKYMYIGHHIGTEYDGYIYPITIEINDELQDGIENIKYKAKENKIVATFEMEELDKWYHFDTIEPPYAFRNGQYYLHSLIFFVLDYESDGTVVIDLTKI